MTDNPTQSMSVPPPPPGTPPPGGPTGSRWSWIKRPIPLWVGLVGLVIGVVLGAASSSTSDEGDASASSPTTIEKSTTTSSTTTSSTTTTTIAPTTTTTLTAEQIRGGSREEFIQAFEQSRVDVASALEDQRDIETVDKFVFDASTEAIILDVTSTWASADNQEDGAWTVTRSFAQFWEPEDGGYWHADYLPALTFVNSGTLYSCSGEFMVRLASLSAGRDDWKREC